MDQRLISHNRIRLLKFMLLAIMAIFVARLFYMQIIQHTKYEALAMNEQFKSLIIPAKRGEIYAMDGVTPVKIVLNENVYTVFVDPTEVKDPDAVVKAVRDISGGTAVSDINDLVRAKPSRYKIVAKNVSRKQAELLQEKHLRGLGFQKTTRRVYPEGQLAAQVLGFVNAEGKGQYGIEEGMNSELKGVDGILRSVTDVSNVPLTIGNKNIRTPAQDGENVVLTIDRNIQSYSEHALADQMQKLGATNGSVLVMDPQSGRIMAMVSMPTYNPEEYTKVMDGNAFNNTTIATPYEPGSVMKTFTAAMALDKGVITPTSTYNNIDKITLDGAPSIGNASKGQTGVITFQHALNWSLNTGYVTVADRLGGVNNPVGIATLNNKAKDVMYDYLYNHFKLGQRTGINLAGEQAGMIIRPTDPEGTPFQYANMAFGQGMNLTMVQVAAGFSSIVNGGKYYAPTVTAGSVDADGNYKPNAAAKPAGQTISPEASAEAKQMIHDARGAFYSSKDKAGYDIGGKTGTSQTLINGSYDNNQTIGSYLGYGGDTMPRYVIMVQMSAPGKTFAGNTDAMPVFTNISNWMIDYMKLQPRN